MQKTISQSEKLGTMPVGKLLASMSIPAIFSMLVQSLYNVVDSIFVSRISEDALTAVSLAFPLQMLTIAFALGVGVGVNSLIARKLGEGDKEAASKTASTGFFLAIINGIIFMLLGIFAARFFMGFFAQDETIVNMGTSYLSIVLIFSFGIFIEMTCSRTLQATGNMIIPMFSQLIGAVINIVLDPIMIFGLLGFPAMGIRGAAIATVIGQIFSMIFVLIMFRIKSHDVHLKIRGFKLEKSYIIEIYKVGLPTIIMNAIGSVTTTFLNGILMSFSSTAVAILGVYFKLQSFIFMPVFGLVQGSMPIMGYNYGANNKKRFMKTLKLALLTSFVIMIIGTSIFWIFPAQLLALFDGSPEMVKMGIYVLRVVSLCFIPASIGITLSTMFQAIGHGFKSLLMSLLRQLVLIIPCAWIFATYIGLGAVWFCYPLAEITCALIFMPFAFVVVKKAFATKSIE